MKPKISDKARQFKRSISPIRQIMNYADPSYIESFGVSREELISYAGGWVNHAAPEELRLAYQEIVTDKDLFHKCGAYPHPLGNLEFKEAVIEFERYVYGMDRLAVEQIAVGLGSTQLGMDLFEALLNPGDKLLLLDPSYCNYPTQAVTAIPGVKILRFPVLDEKTWEYQADSQAESFRSFILQNKPKAVLIVSPDNPTSRIPSDAFISAALEAVTEIGSVLILDFAYKELVFDQAHPRYFSWSPSDNFISLRSNSKWCRGLGRRLGWLEAPSFVIESMESLQNSSILCPDMLHQMAMTTYIRNAIKNGTLLPYLRETREMYQRAAKETLHSIARFLGYPTLNPQGGLFTCMKVPGDGARFVDETLRTTGVLFVPGWGFGRTARNAVRVSYGPLVNNLETIALGFEKMAAHLGKERRTA